MAQLLNQYFVKKVFDKGNDISLSNGNEVVLIKKMAS